MLGISKAKFRQNISSVFIFIRTNKVFIRRILNPVDFGWIFKFFEKFLIIFAKILTILGTKKIKWAETSKNKGLSQDFLIIGLQEKKNTERLYFQFKNSWF